MTATKPRATASLCWSLYISCPSCDESNDLSDPEHDQDHEVAGAIFTNAWDKLKGREVTCQRCGHEFEIEMVEY